MLGTYVGLQVPQPSAGPASSCMASGPTWTAATAPTVGTFSSSLPVYGGGVWVALSSVGGAGVRSTNNGASWSSVSPGAGEWKRIAYGNGTFVAVAGNASPSQLAATSADGQTWTSGARMPSPRYWYALGFGNGVFLAVAYSGGTGTLAMARSTDGVTWTSLTAPASSNWRQVAYGSGKWVLVSESSYLSYTSTDDGSSWSAGGTIPAIGPIFNLAFGGGVFIASAGTNKVAVSANAGASWTEVTLPFTGSTAAPAYHGGMWVIQGSGANVGKVAISEDGYTWAEKSVPLTSVLAWGGSGLRFVGVSPAAGVAIYGECPSGASPVPAAPAGIVAAMSSKQLSLSAQMAGAIGAPAAPVLEVGICGMHHGTSYQFGATVLVSARDRTARLAAGCINPYMDRTPDRPYSVEWETAEDPDAVGTVAGVDYLPVNSGSPGYGGTPWYYYASVLRAIEIPLRTERPPYGKPDSSFIVRLKNATGWSLMTGGSEVRVVHRNSWPLPVMSLERIDYSPTLISWKATLDADFYIDQTVSLTPVVALETGSPPPGLASIDAIEVSLDDGATWTLLSESASEATFTLPAGAKSFMFRFVGAITGRLTDGQLNCDARLEVRLSAIVKRTPIFYIAR